MLAVNMVSADNKNKNTNKTNNKQAKTSDHA